jgi:hypothetical protein
MSTLFERQSRVAKDILQKFLTARLFDLGGDDGKLEKLREAAEELAQILQGASARAAAFTIVSIDAKTPPDEPILKEVASLVEQKWNSYIGAFAETALPVVMRAVILEAISRSVGNDDVALAVSLTARNFLPYLGTSSDKELWQEIFDEAHIRVERRARREWALPSATSTEELALDLPKPVEIVAQTLKVDFITPMFVAASGPNDAENKAVANGNPHWPNSGSSWSWEFAPRAAKAIAAGVDAVSKANVQKLNEHLQSDDRIEKFADLLKSTLSSYLQKAKGLERRTSLIWWKEALYSPDADESYRHMAVGKAMVWLAVDAASITGSYAPRMAEAVVAEAIRAFMGEKADQAIPLLDLCNDATPGSTVADNKLRSHLQLVHAESGRTQLTRLLATDDPAQFISSRLGLPMELAISPIEFARWIFRDIQIARGTNLSTRTAPKAS